MLLIVNKPSWITSFDCVRALKKQFPKQKIWHSGTLDPMACGLMIIWVWKWTKQLNQIQWLDKTYITKIDFSKNSDTWDLEYRDFFEELEIDTLNKISKNEIESKIKTLIPNYDLPLSGFSAKKKDGKKLYELARKWEFQETKKSMKTNNFEILEYDFPILKLKLDVWSGTYIRSIWYRLWKEFENWWILTYLERISIWKYNIKDFTLDKKAIWRKDDIEYEIKFTQMQE